MNTRKSGVLLHITSLPGTPGIGTLGKEAYKFADWLHEAHQTLWQVLPLGPTGYGDSPYASFSTFAGNPLLVDLDDLFLRGWAKSEDIVPPEYIKSAGPVDFGSVVWWKLPVLKKCAAQFTAQATADDKEKFESFCKEKKGWLDSFALFMSIKECYDKKAQAEKLSGLKTVWNQYWPKELARCDAKAIAAWKKEHSGSIESYKIIQFFFTTQWTALKKYVNELGIKIVGDIPIFVALDSADVWANQQLFQMDRKTLLQKACAGVPPDYFSATGQLLGNPLYDWSAMKKDNYAWWIARIKNMLSLVDMVRIDHFRRFDSYWSVPYGAANAIGGKWVKGPGIARFDAIKAALSSNKSSHGELPIIAEDLGVITDKVAFLWDSCGFPGMKILQFAFNGNKFNAESADNAYLPHNYTNSKCVVYTGTHDNDTTVGWLSTSGIENMLNVARYVGLYGEKNPVVLSKALMRTAFASSAELCVVPLQDVYDVGTEGRMNTPATTGTNWAWRMGSTMFTKDAASELAEFSLLYSRNESAEK